MSFKLAVYVEANGIDILKERGAREALDRHLKELEIEKVYLEIFRGHERALRFSGKFLGLDDVKNIKEYYEKKEIEIAGGLCIGTWSEGFGRQAIDQDGNPINLPCYSANSTKEFYRKVAHRAANIFNEVLIDDWLFTDCFCRECLDLFNSKFGYTMDIKELNTAILRENEKIVNDWMKFRCELINDFSRKLVKFAKETNDRVKINWKFPAWNNHFYFRGIDLYKIRDVYDEFYIGTEAREGASRYAPFHSFQYLKSIMGKKAVGAWFDILNGWDWSLSISVARYVNQFRLSVLSGAKEIILWCYPEIMKEERKTHLEKLAEVLPEMRRLSEESRGHIGLCTRRKQSVQALHSPEGYIFDDLGTMGIPIKPIGKKEGANKVEMVTIHSADFDYREFLQHGGRIIVTSEAAQKMVNQGKADILGLSAKKPIHQEMVMVNQFIARDNRKFMTRMCQLVPVGPILCPDNAKPLLMAKGQGEEQTYPVILRNKYLKGEVLIYCLTKFPLYLHTFYPEVTRQMLRDYLGQIIGIKVSSKHATLAPVGLFPMKETIVLVNYNSYPIKLLLWIKPELLGGKIEINLPLKEDDSCEEGVLQCELLLEAEEVKTLPLMKGP